jgi:hypothetical protein
MGNTGSVQEVAGDWCSCSKQAGEYANPPSMRPLIHEAELRGDPSELPHGPNVAQEAQEAPDYAYPSDPAGYRLGAAAHAKDPTPAAPSALYVPSQVGPICRLQPQIQYSVQIAGNLP